MGRRRTLAMADIRANIPMNLFDYVADQMASSKRRPAPGPRPKGKKGVAAGKGGGPDGGFFPLVEEDGLAFRVVSHPARPSSSRSEADSALTRAKLLGDAFR